MGAALSLGISYPGAGKRSRGVALVGLGSLSLVRPLGKRHPTPSPASNSCNSYHKLIYSPPRVVNKKQLPHPDAPRGPIQRGPYPEGSPSPGLPCTRGPSHPFPGPEMCKSQCKERLWQGEPRVPRVGVGSSQRTPEFVGLGVQSLRQPPLLKAASTRGQQGPELGGGREAWKSN